MNTGRPVRVGVSLHSGYPFWRATPAHLASLEIGPGVRVSNMTNSPTADELSTVEVYFGWRFDADWLRSAPRLRWIASPAAGTDHLPVEAAHAAGIRVTRAFGYHARPMAEHAMGMVLAFSRGLLVSHQLQRTRLWWKDEIAARFFDLSGSTMVIVGCGHVGTELARIAGCFGMTVVGVRRCPPADSALTWAPADRVNTALARAQVVINLLPATRHTHRYFDAERIAGIKPGAVLVNLGRASTIDHAALLAALDTGHLAGCGLDVLPVKPPELDDPLRHHPRVLLTPKSAVFTRTYMDSAVEFFATNLRRYLAGRPLVGQVAPDIPIVREDSMP